MASVNKKQLIAIIAIVLVTNGITAAVIVSTHDSDKSSGTVKYNGTALSPTTLLKQPTQYTGQTIDVKGSIVHSADGYYVVGQEKKSPGALKLDFSSSKLDPTKYADEPGVPQSQVVASTGNNQPPSASDTKVTTKGQFTVTGKLVQTAPSKPLSFVVQSIK